MFRSGKEVIEWVSEQLRFGIRPGLERMQAALDKNKNGFLFPKPIHIRKG